MRTLMLSLLLALAGTGAVSAADDDTVYQLSTIDALLSGLYDGVAPVGAVAAHGGFGLGTFDRLDGEMIVLDGVIYQAAFDGAVNVMPGTARSPFLVVTRCDADWFLPAPAGVSYQDWRTWLEARLPSPNLFYAVRVDGRFRDMRVRSVPRQDRKPYPPLAEVAAGQAVFDRASGDGTLLGFWCPAYAKGLNVPGFHLHFLAAERDYGGHVLDFTIAEGRVRIDTTAGWRIQLPLDPAFADADLARDRTGALHAVERSPGGAAPTLPAAPPP